MAAVRSDDDWSDESETDRSWQAYEDWCQARWVELASANDPPVCPHGEKGYCAPCEIAWDRETSPDREGREG
jgi:hypothetical protein